MRRRFFVMNGSVLTYTSITNQKLAINPSAFNIPVKSHTYDEIGLIKFNGVLSEIASDMFRDSYSVLTCVLPTTITKIGDSAFSAYYNLTSITIPDSVVSIGERAFYNCIILTSVTIGNSVKTIGERAFSGCTSLTSVTIGNGVTSIGNYAFYWCESLTSVYCKATTPPTLGSTSVFSSNATDRKIYVPYQSLDAYKTASNWSNYADDIVGYDFENDTIV